jgi:hypothetical protein
MSKMISIQSGWRNIMPLWKVYHPVGAYSAQDKKEFAEKVTAMYSGIPIPNFYVVMIFEAGELTVRLAKRALEKLGALQPAPDRPRKSPNRSAI